MRERSCQMTSDVVPIVMCILSAILALFSIPLNGAVLLAILRNKKFHTNFYLIIFNTTVADFTIGTILCPLSVAIHVREIRHREVTYAVDTIFHFGLFTLAMVSVLSITVLSVDRMISLKFPSKYRLMQRKNFALSLVSVWFIAAALSPIYFFLDYSLFLTLISVSAVLVTAAMMLVTYWFYRTRLRHAFIRSHSNPKEYIIPNIDDDDTADIGVVGRGEGATTNNDESNYGKVIKSPSSADQRVQRHSQQLPHHHHQQQQHQQQNMIDLEHAISAGTTGNSPTVLRREQTKSNAPAEDIEKAADNTTSGNITTFSTLQLIPMSVKRRLINTKSNSKKQSIVSLSSTYKMDEEYQIYLMEKRVTNTFFYMMLVFFLCYIPVVAISLCIHLAKGKQGCFTSTLLEECIAILCIVSSVCKTVVFLCRLTALRKACVNLLISDEQMEKRWRKESVPMVPKKEKASLKENLLSSLSRENGVDEEKETEEKL